MKQTTSSARTQKVEEGAEERRSARVSPTTAAIADPGCRMGETPTAAQGDSVSGPVECKKPERRRFTAEYKLWLLREIDQCTEHGQIVALLRREGLYFSHLSTWRKQRDDALVAGAMPKRRGRKPRDLDSLSVENKRLQRENRHLKAKLRQAKTTRDVAEEALPEEERFPPAIH
jgi:hypothetical protein